MASDFNWNWTYFCPTGLTPWEPHNKYLAPCFQEICLQLPTLAIFAIISAYYFGRQTVLVRRDALQQFLISMRIMAVTFIIILQFYKMFELIVTKMHIWPIDILLCGFQIISWFIHMGNTYNFVLIKYANDDSHPKHIFKFKDFYSHFVIMAI